MIITELAGHTLYIPKGYVSSFMGYAGHVQIHALLPCLEPETEENRQEFHPLGHGRVLIANLDAWDPHYLEGKRLLDAYVEESQHAQERDTSLRGIEIGPIPLGRTGFDKYRDLLSSLDLFTRPGTHPLFVVYCNTKSKFLVSPSCHVHERIWGDVRLYYWYGRSNIEDNVPDTLTIERHLRSLLDSFTNHGPKPEQQAQGRKCK